MEKLLDLLLPLFPKVTEAIDLNLGKEGSELDLLRTQLKCVPDKQLTAKCVIILVVGDLHVLTVAMTKIALGVSLDKNDLGNLHKALLIWYFFRRI